jgi:hypothetical protein
MRLFVFIARIFSAWLNAGRNSQIERLRDEASSAEADGYHTYADLIGELIPRLRIC